MADLEDEDQYLTGRHCHSDDDIGDDWQFMEKQRPLITEELWDINEEDLECDLNMNQRVPIVEVYPSSWLENKIKSLTKWILVFLCLWSSYCSVSDNALDILLCFFKSMLESLATLFPVIAGFAALMPKSLHLFHKQLGMDKDKFVNYVVCKKCATLYSFEDCLSVRNGKTVAKKCSHVAFPHHRQAFHRIPCNEPLLKEVTLKNGQVRLYPHKVYCYNSITDTLKQLIQRQGFVTRCEQWRLRGTSDGFLSDIFDGRMWKDWQYVDGKPYLASPNNYAFMLNVDWFQPFKHSLYSVGALYIVLTNLPMAERFNPGNIFLVGIIPGPHEPRLTINTYLQPLVDELNILWKKGINVQTPSGGVQHFHAALLCVACDVPAARKVCGFTGHNSSKGCSKCNKCVFQTDGQIY